MKKVLPIVISLLLLLQTGLVSSYPPWIVGAPEWQERWEEALRLLTPGERWEASFIRELREGAPAGGDRVCAATLNYVVFCGPDELRGIPERALFDASMLLHEATHLRNIPAGEFFNECLAYTRQVDFLMGRIDTERGVYLMVLVMLQRDAACGRKKT